MTFWITASFVAGLIPAVALLVLYGFRTAWYRTFTGRVVFGLVAVTAISYGLSVFTLVWPEFWRAQAGETTRVVIRFAVALVLWGLLAVYVRAQRRGSRWAERKEQEPV